VIAYTMFVRDESGGNKSENEMRWLSRDGAANSSLLCVAVHFGFL